MNMKQIYFLLSSLFILSISTNLLAQRQEILINDNWDFRFSHEVEQRSGQRVDLPHTWNTTDALSGKIDYKRGIGNYEKSLYIDQEWQGKRLFIRFNGANSVANLLVNGKHIGEHRGGYAAFIFEITDHVQYGKDNKILVRVNNAEQLDVMPLVGDFNFYGGIYRDVHLLVTNDVCISPLDYASSGVYLMQQSVSEQKADLAAQIQLLNGSAKEKWMTLKMKIKDGERVVREDILNFTLPPDSESQENIVFSIENPRLWNGTADPFMYRAIVELYENDKLIDTMEQPLGLRYYATDAQNGFYLNGNHLQLRGVCRHQDRAERGNALFIEHHNEDMEIMLEMGVNAVRLAHYPQAKEMYELTDKHGIVTWAEIPFIGPGGYKDKGFVDMESFKQNGELQLIELIKQNFNHPSICFWGLFNELKEDGDNPVEYIKQLNELAHRLDPSRPTVAASNQGGELNFLTDLIAWNRYDGWYGGMPKKLGEFLDATHSNNPQLRIGVSEYGAGASIYHQQDSLVKTVPTSWWHPENWQTYYHIESWKAISERPFVWGSFVWNMFDFGAAHRTEGDRPGINDKGLVTFDRKIKKDAFYFYKANWNKDEKFVYLANKRNTHVSTSELTITVFTNTKGAELLVNGKSMGQQNSDKFATIVWQDIPLLKGQNSIKVFSTENGSILDEVSLFR